MAGFVVAFLAALVVMRWASRHISDGEDAMALTVAVFIALLVALV